MRKMISGAVTVLAAAALGAGGVAQAASTPSGATPDTQFAGYYDAQVPGPIRAVSADWVEPRVIPHGYHDAYALFSTGFDTSNTVEPGFSDELIGTDADSIGGHPVYFAWYSGHDGGRIKFRDSVHPGDHMSASVTNRGPQQNHCTLSLTDVRFRRHHAPARWTQTVRQTCYAPFAAVAGVTSPLYGLMLLADFGTLKLTGVSINGEVLGSYDPYVGWYYLANFVDGYTHHLTSTSSLDAKGDSFTVTWLRSK